MRGILLVFAAILLLGCVAEEVPEAEEEIVTDVDCPGCYTDEEVEEETKEEVTEEIEEGTEEEPEEIEEPVNETEETEEEDEYPDIGCHGPSEYNIYIADYVIMNGTRYNDTCVVSDVVKKYYCADDVMKAMNEECPPGYVCKFGACEEYVGTCDDSDANDIMFKGHVDISEAPFSSSRETDECYDDGSVREWLCDDEGIEGYYELIYCGSGLRCENGKCVKSDCSETDGGDNPEIEGEVETGDGDVFKDDCLDDYTLKEYYCYGERAESKTYDCVGRCKSDACTLVGFEG